MKKLLSAAIVSALLIPVGPANAEILKNLKVGGQLDIQANSGRNITDFATRQDGRFPTAGSSNNDRISDAATRLMLDLSWDLLDDVHANVSLVKNDRAWGTAGGAGQGGANIVNATGAQAQSIGAGGIQANTFVQQANVKIDKVFGHVDTTLGRQYYGDMGDLIIYYGPKNNYGLTVEAIDAARFDAANDKVTFTGLVGKIAGSGIGTTGNGDVDVHGFDLGIKNLPVKTDAFIWRRVIHGAGALGRAPSNTTASTGLNDNLWVLGVKLHGEAMGGWANATIAANAGQDRTTLAGGGCGSRGCLANTSSYSGKALLVDVGWKAEVANVGGFTPWGNFGWGSGRGSNIENKNEGFTSIASDYRPGIINGRFNTASMLDMTTGNGNSVSSNGLNNRVIWGLGLKFKPAMAEKLTINPQIWDYRLQRNTLAATGGTAGVAPAGNKHIGTEIGITFDWKHSDNVNFGVGAASFQPGGFIIEDNRSVAGVNNRPVNPATLAFADATIRW
jgi:hypothetical protein